MAKKDQSKAHAIWGGEVLSCGIFADIFFLWFFVPIFRGEISIGVFHLIFSIITFGLFQLVMPFLYNKQSSIRLLTNGWELNDTEENNTLARVRIGISF